MSPATDPGRAAEKTIRAEIIAALNAAFRGFSFPGGRWSTGYGAEMAADALLSGPLAPILQEAAQLRARLHEAEKALRPFAGCVFNDNGDVTVSTGHLTTHDWLSAKLALMTQEESNA